MLSLILQILLLSNSSFALEGDFSYQGQNEIIQVRHNRVLYKKSSLHMKMYQELKNQGYNCQSKRDFFHCVKFLKDKPKPKQMPESPHMMVEFQEPTQIDLITESDHFTQWIAVQKVSIDEMEFAKVAYSKTPSHLKIEVEPDSIHSIHFIEYEDQIGELLQTQEKKSRWEWTTYIIEFFYNQGE